MSDVRSIRVMMPGQTQPYLGGIATITMPRMPGKIDRYNGQRIINLTANLHDLSLGKAIRPIEEAIGKAGNPPRGVSVQMRGEEPGLQQTLSGLRIGLLLAIGRFFCCSLRTFSRSVILWRSC